MGSAISRYAYYVHHSADNAEKNLPKGQLLHNYALSKMRKASSNQFRSKISSTVKMDYAKAINAVHGRQGSFDSEKWRISPAEIRTEVVRMLNEKFDNFLKNQRGFLELETGRILNGEKSIKSNRYHTTYIPEQKIYEYIEDMQDLQDQLKKLSRPSKGLDEAVFDNLKKDLNQLLQELQQQLTKLAQKGEVTQGKDIKDKRLLPETSYLPISADYTQKFREVNKLINKLRLQMPALNAEQGYSEEVIALGASYMIAGVMADSLTDAFNEAASHKTINTALASRAGALTGRVSSTFEWKIQGLPSETMAKLWINQTNKDKATYVHNTGAQQKVDIVVNLPTTNLPEASLTPVPASVKNVNLQSDFGIHLVSGTNVWYLIQDEEVSFLRKYLNIMSGHNQTKANPSGTTLSAYKKEAQLAIKILSAWKALSGATLGRTAAKLFIVNDNAGKKAYVLEIADILKLIYNNIYSNPSAIDNYFDYHMNDIYYRNIWVDATEIGLAEALDTRMASIINQVHEHKISVILQNSAARNIFNRLEKVYSI